MRTNRRAAFTFIEIMVSVGLTSILGLVLYALSSEAMTSFSRNISINKSYTDARIALDAIGQKIQAAGHTPILTDANGLATSAAQAEGIRFYAYDNLPECKISGSLAMGSSAIKEDLTYNPTLPVKGSIVFIGSIGFQGVVSSVTVSGSIATINFPDTLTNLCQTTTVYTTTAATPPTVFVLFNQVAFVVANYQLRYYPSAMQAAVDGTVAYNNPSNYLVLANLVTTPNSNTPEQAKPFLDGAGNTIQVIMCTQAPDYSNRASLTSGGNTYCRMQSSFAPRCPVILRSSTKYPF